MPKSEASAEAAPEPRTSRRKRRTRARLLKAALQLMADRGIEGVAINEITEEADVGFGTFYNYFDSKEAIYEALVSEVFDDFGAALGHIAEQIDDPAEAFVASLRYMLRRAAEEPLWGRFLAHTGFFWPQAIDEGLGQQVIRDLRAAVGAGHIEDPDLTMTIVAIRGVMLSAIDVQARLSSPAGVERGFARALGDDVDQIPERAAAVILRLIGIMPQEAKEIANRPLPEVELPQNPLNNP
ncbi:MAG: TetR/AcrR family transcriptional regulator [Myxococcota bacterium]